MGGGGTRAAWCIEEQIAARGPNGKEARTAPRCFPSSSGSTHTVHQLGGEGPMIAPIPISPDFGDCIHRHSRARSARRSCARGQELPALLGKRRTASDRPHLKEFWLIAALDLPVAAPFQSGVRIDRSVVEQGGRSSGLQCTPVELSWRRIVSSHRTYTRRKDDRVGRTS